MKKHASRARGQFAFSLNGVSRSAKQIGTTRRRFIQGAAAAPFLAALSPYAIVSTESQAGDTMTNCTLGFNGERKDPVSGVYHLGAGYRAYSPVLMRFNAADSISPFGRGGVNSYAYCLGDPVNRCDPSGHVAILSLLIGAIAGSVLGASVTAVGEGIRAAATGTRFDWKQVGIGAALGFISGGFGAAMSGTKLAVKIGLTVSDAVVSGAADFGLSVASGSTIQEAGEKVGIGVAVGLFSFGVGEIAGRAMMPRYRLTQIAHQHTIPLRNRSTSFARYTDASYIDTDYGRLTIHAHGSEGLLALEEGLLSGPELAEVLSARGLENYRIITLESCHSADGGTYRSLAQSLSNHTGTRVIGFRGEVGAEQFNDLASPFSRSFSPQSKIRQRFTAFLHRRYANDRKQELYRRHPAWENF